MVPTASRAPLLLPRGIEIAKQRHGPNGDRARLVRCTTDETYTALRERQRGQPSEEGTR